MNAQSKPQYWVIIPAAGIGKRMGEKKPKQYLKFKNSTIIESTLSIFVKHPKVSQVIVALHANDTHWSRLPKQEKITTTLGGKTRAESVMRALEYLTGMAQQNDWVLVHDAVRPCLTTEILDRLIENLQEHPVGGLLAIPVVDTLKKVDAANHVVQETVARENLWAAQTPQLFRFGILYDAMKKALDSKVTITDESSAIEFSGESPMVVEGDPKNIKITTPKSLSMAERSTVKSDHGGT